MNFYQRAQPEEDIEQEEYNEWYMKSFSQLCNQTDEEGRVLCSYISDPKDHICSVQCE